MANRIPGLDNGVSLNDIYFCYIRLKVQIE